MGDVDSNLWFFFLDVWLGNDHRFLTTSEHSFVVFYETPLLIEKDGNKFRSTSPIEWPDLTDIEAQSICILKPKPTNEKRGKCLNNVSYDLTTLSRKRPNDPSIRRGMSEILRFSLMGGHQSLH